MFYQNLDKTRGPNASGGNKKTQLICPRLVDNVQPQGFKK